MKCFIIHAFFFQGDVLECIRSKVVRLLGNDLPPLVDKRKEIDIQSGDKCTNRLLTVESDHINKVTVVEETVIETLLTSSSESYVQTQLETTFDPQIRPQFESTCVDNSNINIVVDDELFHGFDEPFDMPSIEKDKAMDVPVVRVGSDEWSRGLVTNSDGRIVHVSLPLLLSCTHKVICCFSISR